MKLRLPQETLAGCMWLPRFTDKLRAHRAGTLPSEYQFAFCHPRGVDGHFFRHFGFTKEMIVPAITEAADDASVAAWFLAQPGVNEATIATWNACAPDIGRAGHPGHEAFRFMRRRLYGDTPPVPLNSAFEGIYFDETGSPTPPLQA